MADEIPSTLDSLYDEGATGINQETMDRDIEALGPYRVDDVDAECGNDPNPSWDHDPTETRLDNNFDDGPEL